MGKSLGLRSEEGYNPGELLIKTEASWGHWNLLMPLVALHDATALWKPVRHGLELSYVLQSCHMAHKFPSQVSSQPGDMKVSVDTKRTCECSQQPK